MVWGQSWGVNEGVRRVRSLSDVCGGSGQGGDTFVVCVDRHLSPLPFYNGSEICSSHGE